MWVLVVISPQTYRPLMLFIGAWATFRAFPTSGRFGPAVDTLWIIAGIVGLGWPLANGEAFLYRTANPTGGDVLAGVLAIVVVIEAARRTTGWILPIAALAFLTYAIAGPWFVDIGLTGIAHRGYDLPRLVGNLYMTLEGIYGIPLDVAVTYIVLFSIYGAMLEHSGAGRFFIDFAMSLTSRAAPARAAGRSVTLAGFLLGTVSGSGVATTVTLGSVAWPVLRRVGYSPETAGGLLAAAGIGALLSPPTLGAAAFLIAEYLRISYLDVLVMATVPTILYYASIALMIEGEASPKTIPGVVSTIVDTETTPGIVSPPLREWFHFLSLGLIAVLMVAGMTPFRAVFWATVAAVGLSVLGRPGERMTPRRIARALEAGGRDVLPVLATTAVAGIIVGVVTLTGLGLKVAGLIVGLAGGSLVLTVIYAAAAVWILGLAVPVTASYIISAVMVVPALTTVGVPAVAAHMFIFYYAVLSEVSPPTALAPFAAAALTGGRPFRTMMVTWKFAVPAFVVPFAFTLDPRGMGLLLQAGWADVALTGATALAGIAGLGMGLGRIWLRAPSIPARIAAVGGGLLLVHPAPLADLTGAVAVAAAVVLSRLARHG